jgi:hypothetical protein
VSRPRGEDGSVLVLVLGFTGILVVLVAVVVNVSAVVLAKRGVASAADGAAVSAAQSLDLAQLYAAGLGEAIPLSGSEAVARVAAYEVRARREQPGISLAVRVDGRTAVVTGQRTVRLPFRLPGTGPVQVRSVARARAPVAP